ncbi:hypothetical protein C5B42_01915 [Candidatus Cerribacteria bacterium 'Amazon FNV 2010 28 9']|uniref:Bacterial toxin RNase RnlA/LsoA DBD domain-containing protein n=1 Tax=Candidatus Cerribacteria bacterium 'Amazon FNV 2010 28 9' TaxID=2081795 RepID=A0A317JPA9_9BACT|nr:MAG: hypothetical protein C5B42_01915 [Candidatus Cerribacteria bacterium 'Amazon FNV 2010 28 9']
MPLEHNFTHARWYMFMTPQERTLADLSSELFDREERLHSSYADYSFVVFPLSKAYEGFLKEFLFHLKLIDATEYAHREFRIGRSLNPDIPVRHQDEYWLYGKLVATCGEELSRKLWNIWLEARNHLFHYFPDAQHNISLAQAKELLLKLSTTMEEACACLKDHVQ